MEEIMEKKVFKIFNNRKIGDYAHGLACQTCLKKTEIKLELLTDIDMLLMVEKGIRGGMCHAIHTYSKANNEYMKNYDKNKKIIINSIFRRK